MTSTENLIESQREALLELGFRRLHGFSYEIVVGVRRVEMVIRSDGKWVATATERDVFDRVVLDEGMSLRAFIAVVSAFI